MKTEIEKITDVEQVVAVEQLLTQIGIMTEIDVAEDDDDDDILFEELETSMMLMTLFDKYGVERSYIRAKSAYNRIKNVSDKDEIIVSTVLFAIIKVVYHFVNSFSYGMDENYDKAVSHMLKANGECKNAIKSIKKIEKFIENDDEVSPVINMLKFILIFYELLSNVSVEKSLNDLAINDNKYVNMGEYLKIYANRIRKINDYDVPEDIKEIVIPIIIFANKLADSYDKQAEKIGHNNRTIKFMPPIDNKVFIVHGHSKHTLKELKSILQSDCNIEPIILNEMRDNGKTLIEKFEDYARFTGFAFIIITPDDFVTKDGKMYFQGRPNVLFELGWFCGRFGRNRIRIIRQTNATIPSDLNGILTMEFNEELEEVRKSIIADLKDSGIISEK